MVKQKNIEFDKIPIKVFYIFVNKDRKYKTNYQISI